MSFRPSLESLTDSKMPDLDLETLFNHPEGLRAARELAARYIAVYENESARQENQGIRSTTSSYTTKKDPEMPDALKNLLSFSDSQAQSPRVRSRTIEAMEVDNSNEASEQCKSLIYSVKNSATVLNFTSQLT